VLYFSQDELISYSWLPLDVQPDTPQILPPLSTSPLPEGLGWVPISLSTEGFLIFSFRQNPKTLPRSSISRHFSFFRRARLICSVARVPCAFFPVLESFPPGTSSSSRYPCSTFPRIRVFPSSPQTPPSFALSFSLPFPLSFLFSDKTWALYLFLFFGEYSTRLAKSMAPRACRHSPPKFLVVQFGV